MSWAPSLGPQANSGVTQGHIVHATSHPRLQQDAYQAKRPQREELGKPIEVLGFLGSFRARTADAMHLRGLYFVYFEIGAARMPR